MVTYVISLSQWLRDSIGNKIKEDVSMSMLTTHVVIPVISSNRLENDIYREEIRKEKQGWRRIGEPVKIDDTVVDGVHIPHIVVLLFERDTPIPFKNDAESDPQTLDEANWIFG